MATSISGKTRHEVAAMIKGGELSQKEAEKLVAERAVSNLRKALDKLA